MKTLHAAYFDRQEHEVVTYDYVGESNLFRKQLGNGATLTMDRDDYRRPTRFLWESVSGETLLDHEYSYDSLDRVSTESLGHDLDALGTPRVNRYRYNARDEITGADLRSLAAPGSVYPSQFNFDQLFNRSQAVEVGLFPGAAPLVDDQYAVDQANRYSDLKRNGQTFKLTYDLAGNGTGVALRPVSSGADSFGELDYDAENLPIHVRVGGETFRYIYDPFRRRIATLQLQGQTIETGSRRYIYDGFTTVAERVFQNSTLAAPVSYNERIYVHGIGIDDPILAAIDGNGDGLLDDGTLNQPQAGADHEYYFLTGGMGHVGALLNATDSDHVLERYGYSLYGYPTVLIPHDTDGDGYEDTPLDQADNFAGSLATRESRHGNSYLFAGRRFDWGTGLYYNRHRYLDPLSGRFISRDPLGSWTDPANRGNAYAYVGSSPTNGHDPMGLEDCAWKTVIEGPWILKDRRVLASWDSGAVVKMTSSEYTEVYKRGRFKVGIEMKSGITIFGSGAEAKAAAEAETGVKSGSKNRDNQGDDVPLDLQFGGMGH